MSTVQSYSLEEIYDQEAKMAEEDRSFYKVYDQEERRAAAQAQAIGERITELVEQYHEAKGPHACEQIAQQIWELPLSVGVRSGWQNLADTPLEARQYKIILAWGGPAVRIVGELNANAYPVTASLQGQDWGTEWFTVPADEGLLLDFARHFTFRC